MPTGPEIQRARVSRELPQRGSLNPTNEDSLFLVVSLLSSLFCVGLRCLPDCVTFFLSHEFRKMSVCVKCLNTFDLHKNVAAVLLTMLHLGVTEFWLKQLLSLSTQFSGGRLSR